MYQISQIVLVLLSLTAAFQCMVIEQYPDNAISQFTSSRNDGGWKRHRRHRHSNGRRHRGRKVNYSHHRKQNSIDSQEQLPNVEFMYSPRVVLSPHKPLLPPVDLLEPPEDLNGLAQTAVEISNDTETENDLIQNIHRRSKRSLDYVHVPVCEGVSEWVERRQAHNMWGYQVEVLQEIDIGGARVNQYFYETKCRNEKSACVGIDTNQFFSVCKNKHVWAYAKIRTSAGDEGWNLIKIPGSCNCALFKKKAKRLSLLDLLQDIR